MIDDIFDADRWKSGKDIFDIEHGPYLGRLLLGAKQTTVHEGFSMWHLLAVKCLEPGDQLVFLQSASEESSDLLLDDIRESCAVISNDWRKTWMRWASYRRKSYNGSRFSWRILQERTSWRTPLEICKELAIPLIIWPEGYEHFGEERFHPVIEAAQAQSLRNLKHLDQL